MLEKVKNNMFVIIVAGIFVIVGAVWLFGEKLEPIADTNGAEDFTLQTITDEDIINNDMGSYKPMSMVSKPGGYLKFSSDEFSGVYEIYYDIYLGTSDFVVNLENFQVTDGNLKMCVVYDGKVVEVIEPAESVRYCLEDVKGEVSLMLAGESAAYSFEIARVDYEMHSVR